MIATPLILRMTPDWVEIVLAGAAVGLFLALDWVLWRSLRTDLRVRETWLVNLRNRPRV